MTADQRDGGRVLPVAVIGLGDIARKAYLPVLGATPGIDPLLMTRDRAKLDRIGDAYRIGRRTTDLDAVIASGVEAAFVHAPTDQHPAIVTRLLEAGIHVFVDKPLAYRIEDARALVALAEARGLSLMVGFNRRYAPAYAAALDAPRDLIVMRKDRHDSAADPRTVVLDDFIHLADTLRFLMPGHPDDGPVSVGDVRARVVDGLLHHLVLRLDAPGTSAFGILDRMSGAAAEHLETSGGGRRREVHDLVDVVEHAGGGTRVHRAGDWDSVGDRRGMAPMCAHFLEAVRAGRILNARDALATHELCEEILERIGAA